VIVAMGAESTVAHAVSFIDAVTESVAVKDCAPAVLNVIKTPVFLPAESLVGDGRVAAGSLVVTTAVPL
jgi:hypothetical protein